MSETTVTSKKNESKEESSKATPEQLEVLNELFDCYKIVVDSVMRTLKRPRDIEVGNSLMQLCESMKANEDLRVKKGVNDFCAFFLRILKNTSVNQPIAVYNCWYDDKSENSASKSPWLEPEKAYWSSKTLDDGSVVVYTAIASDATAGWQDKGLKLLYEEKADADKK